MTPLSLTRRLELLEQQVAAQDRVIAALERTARLRSERWAYLAQTCTVYGSEYPEAAGANTFGLTFLDRQYTAAEGAQTVADVLRSSDRQAVGTTLNGQWVMEGEQVLVFPAPPPPGTTGKGRWCILPQKTYYWGKLKAALEARASAAVDVWRLVGGTWEDSDFDQTVWDRLLTGGVSLEANTWVRFEWETSRWIVTSAGCEPEEDPYA